LAGDLQLCYDGRILDEYMDVLHRPYFGFGQAEAEGKRKP